MASEKPLPDRCGAAVTTKVGLEIHASQVTVTEARLTSGDTVEIDLSAFDDYTGEERRSSTEKEVEDYDYHIDDLVVEEVVLDRESDPEPIVEPPEWDDVIGYLRSEFEITELVLELDGGHTAVVDDHDERVVATLSIADDEDPYVRNRDSELEGYCERYPMDCGRCYNHGGLDNGANEGNTNAMTHGLRAKRTNFYQSRSDDDKAFVESMVDSWLENVPFERDNQAKVNELYRIAIDQLRLWYAVDEYVDDDGDVKNLAYEQVVDWDDDGNPQTEVDANPVNLEYSRLDRDNISKLKDLGALDDPDSQQADATTSLAQKLSGLDDNDE